MNIVLVCSAGMSTSMLVKKMKQAAEDLGDSVNIHATSESQLTQYLESADVILIGPQVRYLEPKIREKAQPYGIQVGTIEATHYGMMDGKKVLAQAQNLRKS